MRIKDGIILKYISDKEYESRMKQIKNQNANRERLQALKAEQNKYRFQIKMPSTSKMMAMYLFVILNVVLIYAMVTMYSFRDLSYLGVLITDVAAQVLTYFIYARKATIENTSGGITYDIAMKNMENESDEISEDSVG